MRCRPRPSISGQVSCKSSYVIASEFSFLPLESPHARILLHSHLMFPYLMASRSPSDDASAQHPRTTPVKLGSVREEMGDRMGKASKTLAGIGGSRRGSAERALTLSQVIRLRSVDLGSFGGTRVGR